MNESMIERESPAVERLRLRPHEVRGGLSRAITLPAGSLTPGGCMVSRAAEFEEIRHVLSSNLASSSPGSLVASGDSLELLKRMPDSSVSLVLTDPPYHTTKKPNIRNDAAFAEDEHFLEWMEQYAREWRRVMKLSGTLYVFCSSQMSARLEVLIAKYLRPIGHITWAKPNEPGYDGWKGKMKKESLRAWYPHSERILMFEQGEYGTREAYRRSPMGQYLLACRKQSGLSMVELTERIGAFGRVNRGGAVANWEAGRNIPSPEQYASLKSALLATGHVQEMLAYEDLVRPMAVSKDVEFTDTWNFMSVRPFRGKHPAEKPQDMLMHMIQASSYPGDLVLDCFAGSGSTGVAAVRLGRRAVCVEIEPEWVERAAREVSAAGVGAEFEAPTRISHARKVQPDLGLDNLFD